MDNIFDVKVLEECSQQYGMIMFSSYISNVKRNRYGIDVWMQDMILPGHRIYPTVGTFASSLYLRSMLEVNDIQFDVGVNLNENQVFKQKALYAAESIRMIPDFCYIYNMTPGSIMHTISNNFDRVVAWQKLYDWFLEHGRKQDLPQLLEYAQVKIQSRMLLYAKNFV